MQFPASSSEAEAHGFRSATVGSRSRMLMALPSASFLRFRNCSMSSSSSCIAGVNGKRGIPDCAGTGVLAVEATWYGAIALEADTALSGIGAGAYVVLVGNVLITACGVKPPVIKASVAPHSGPVMHTPFSNSVANSSVVKPVGLVLSTMRHVGAGPFSTSESVTATCRSLTAVLLDSVASFAMIGPPAPMPGAARLTPPAPASMVPGVSTPPATMLIPPVALAVTAPPKLFDGFGSAIELAPALMKVVPATLSVPPVWMTGAPGLLMDRLPPIAVVPLAWLYPPRLTSLATASVSEAPFADSVPPEIVETLTWPESAGTAESKTTAAPARFTFATFALSGMALPAQLAGFDQSPSLPRPVQLTDESCVMTPVLLPASVTT